MLVAGGEDNQEVVVLVDHGVDLLRPGLVEGLGSLLVEGAPAVGDNPCAGFIGGEEHFVGEGVGGREIQPLLGVAGILFDSEI